MAKIGGWPIISESPQRIFGFALDPVPFRAIALLFLAVFLRLARAGREQIAYQQQRCSVLEKYGYGPFQRHGVRNYERWFPSGSYTMA